MNMNLAVHERFPVRAFLLTALISGIWINASEIFRYFAFVMPMMRDAFHVVDGIAPMSFGVFSSWMVWGTVLVLGHAGFVWLYLDRFGGGLRNAVIAGTIVWALVFGILWLGLFNMALATPGIVSVALPLAGLEMIVGAIIVDWGRKRFVG